MRQIEFTLLLVCKVREKENLLFFHLQRFVIITHIRLTRFLGV